MEDGSKAWFELVIYGGRMPIGIDAIDLVPQCRGTGAEELLPTRIDRDGNNIGFDIPLTKAICDAWISRLLPAEELPLPQHILEAFEKAGADAVLAAGMFHRGEYTIGQVKEYL